jgi:hypothetical protein
LGASEVFFFKYFGAKQDMLGAKQFFCSKSLDVKEVFCSNIMGAKHFFCSNILGAKQDF